MTSHFRLLKTPSLPLQNENCSFTCCIPDNKICTVLFFHPITLLKNPYESVCSKYANLQ